MSVFPQTFNTAYTFADTTNGGVNRSMTTSYTFSTQETANEQVSYGVPDVASVNVQASQAATQLHQNSIAAQYNTYQGVSTTVFIAETTLPPPAAFCGGCKGGASDPCTSSPGSTTNKWEYADDLEHQWSCRAQLLEILGCSLGGGC